MMTFVVINLTYFTFTSALFFKSGKLHNILSLVVFTITAIIILFCLLIFYKEPARFEYFLFSFRKEFLALHHFYLLILSLFLALPLLVVLPKYAWAPGIPIGLLLTYTLAYRPYKIIKENLRSAFNLSVMLSFIGFRMYVEEKSS